MSKEYNEYLESHISSVIQAGEWMAKNLSYFKEAPLTFKNTFLAVIGMHDKSKYHSQEYNAYDAYFYGEKDEDAFNRAWLHHIHLNPHHWQHWLLMNDDGKYRDPDKVIPLEMPEVCVFEMIADWWSFSWRSGNLNEIFYWYEAHKDNIILHENTRKLVEDTLDEMKTKVKALHAEVDTISPIKQQY